MPDNPGVLGLEIRAMRKACEQMQPYKRSTCPICEWPLRISVDDITECPFCGYTDMSPIIRNVYAD